MLVRLYLGPRQASSNSLAVTIRQMKTLSDNMKITKKLSWMKILINFDLT